jgi:KaiC/GvpD/RAD55 family RecA-like ATPase
MIEFDPSEIANYYRVRVPAVKQMRGREWRGPCPVHDGKDPNFSVEADTGRAHCHSQCSRGWDMMSLEMELLRCDFPTAKKSVFSIVGRPEPSREDADVEATYDYTDEHGNLLYQVVRKYGKKFAQRKPDRERGWIWNLKGITPVPYRLPEVMAADFVAVVEGEKDANNLRRLGITATCNNGGAGNFRGDLARWFTAKHVAILPDFDEPGREHALKVAELLSPVAAGLKVIELPGLALKGDVSDWLAAGGTIEQMRELFRKAPHFSETFEFQIPLKPKESPLADKYLHTFQREIELVGGLDPFWDFTTQHGISTPWQSITSALGGGMRKGEVYVIAGNQGSGKTSMGLQFMISALRQNLGVLCFSMEMSAKNMFQRMAAIEARVDLVEFSKLQKNPLAYSLDLAEMRGRLDRKSIELCPLPLVVSTKSSVTPEYVLEETDRVRAGFGPDLVVIDHMQLMASTGNVRGDYEKFTNISRTMKQIAMELDLPVILVSQTSRNNSLERRAELEVSDLRGSGAIEEDAAAVFLIYEDREDAAKAKQAGYYARGPVKTWLKIGKNRYGLQGICQAFMHAKKYTRFDLYVEGVEPGISTNAADKQPDEERRIWQR